MFVEYRRVLLRSTILLEESRVLPVKVLGVPQNNIENDLREKVLLYSRVETR